MAERYTAPVPGGAPFEGSNGNTRWKVKALKMPAVDLPIPARAGASSVPDQRFSSQITILGTTYNEVKSETFNLDWLPVLTGMAVTHPEFSAAVDNIVKLANTKFKISFGADVTDANKKLWGEHLKRRMKSWYGGREGMRSLTGDLAGMIVSNGPLSAEIVPGYVPTNPGTGVNGVERIIKVDPARVAIGIDKDTGKTQYFQRPRNYLDSQFNGSGVQSDRASGLIALNPETYRYAALRRFGSSPYAVPPMLAAMSPAIRHNSMTNNMGVVMKKVGAFGLTSLMLAKPTKEPGESPETYKARTAQFLQDNVPVATLAASDGIFIGYDKEHLITNQAAPTDGATIKALFDVGDTQLAGGLKQHPNLLGRTAAVTETFARPLIWLLKASIGEIQQMIADLYGDAGTIELALAFPLNHPEFVEYEFELPAIDDNLKDIQVESARKTYADSMVDRGYWSHAYASNWLTGEAPDKPEPGIPAGMAPVGDWKEPGAGGKPGIKPTGKTGEHGPGSARTDPANVTEPATKKAKKENKRLMRSFTAAGEPERNAMLDYAARELYGHITEYDYSMPEGCEPPDEESYAAAPKGDKQAKYSNRYMGAVQPIFRRALRSFTGNLDKLLASLPETSTPQQVTDTVLVNLYRSWDNLFVSKVKAEAKGNTKAIYEYFRRDKAPFANKVNPVPAANLNLKDYRAMEQAAKLDTIYLGKFVTDPGNKKNLYAAIQKIFLDGDAPIGRNSAGIKEVVKATGIVLGSNEYKMRRIIDTTVNRLRAQGSVAYLTEAGVTEYEIVAVMDRLTCDQCQAMNGRTFSVEAAQEFVDKMNNYEGDDFAKAFPFLTKKTPAQVKEASSKDLEASGQALPPFHCHCRDTIVVA